MQTTIKQVGPVEYELDIQATAEDLAPEFNKALRAQRTRTQLKGFRPGKVPLSIVKKMYGEAIAFGVADKSVQEIYEDLVIDSDEHDVLGHPKITALDYEMDGDLHAVIQFGVRPDIEMQALDGETVDTLAHEVDDEEIDNEIDYILEEKADLAPVEDEPIAEADLVLFDLQEVDAATRTPLIGKRDADQHIQRADPSRDDSPLMSAFREAAIGAQPGAVVSFHFEHDKAHDGLVESVEHAHFFEATIKEVKRRDIPELDDDFVQEITNDRLDTVAAFRDEVRKQIEESWKQRAREFLEGNIVERMLALHEVPVPESVIDLYLDSYLEDLKQRNQGELPENFPVEAFLQANRGEAEKQARWMLLRDAFINAEGLDVEDEDLDAFFEQEAEKDENFTPENLRQFYVQMRLMDTLEQRLLNQKIFDLLAGRFEVVEKDLETVEREQAERRAREEAEAQARREEAEARAREEAEAKAREEAEAAEAAVAPGDEVDAPEEDVPSTEVEAETDTETDEAAEVGAEVTAAATTSEEEVMEAVVEEPVAKSKRGLFGFLRRKKG